ncbi:hypothetical protein WN943_009296 [Citrus x changshan-huyou]
MDLHRKVTGPPPDIARPPPEGRGIINVSPRITAGPHRKPYAISSNIKTPWFNLRAAANQQQKCQHKLDKMKKNGAVFTNFESFQVARDHDDSSFKRAVVGKKSVPHSDSLRFHWWPSPCVVIITNFWVVKLTNLSLQAVYPPSRCKRIPISHHHSISTGTMIL